MARFKNNSQGRSASSLARSKAADVQLQDCWPEATPAGIPFTVTTLTVVGGCIHLGCCASDATDCRRNSSSSCAFSSCRARTRAFNAASPSCNSCWPPSEEAAAAATASKMLAASTCDCNSALAAVPVLVVAMGCASSSCSVVSSAQRSFSLELAPVVTSAPDRAGVYDAPAVAAPTDTRECPP